MLERLFGEERRRTKVIPHAFGERAVLKLMYAALILSDGAEAHREDLQIKSSLSVGFIFWIPLAPVTTLKYRL
jgi:hypothetical protein